MSSCKIWKERGCSNGPHTESGCPKQRRMPPLLRLDSTGEISSSRVVNSGQNPKCYGDQQSTSKSGNPVSFKNIFGSLKMTTVLESANAYIGSAASYLEGFCNKSSRKNLVRSDSDTTALQYFQSMWKNQQPVTGKDHSGSFDSVLTQDNSCKPFTDMNHLVTCQEYKMQTTNSATASSATVPNSIFGVLQNTFNNCNSMKSKPEPYIPPPLKNRAARPCSNKGAMFDPKLTPYNARLLARSRNQRPCVETISHKKCQQENRHDTENRSSKTEYEMTTPKHVNNTNDDNKHSVVVQNSTEASNCDNDSSLSDTDAEPDAINDWFDYENNNLEATPVPFDPAKRLHNFESNNHCALSSDDIKPCDPHTPISPSLHSWLSVDFDLDVQKAVEESFHSSQEDGSPKACDNSKTLNLPQTSENRCSESAYIDNNNTSQEEEKHAECIIPSVLYVRNIHNSRQRRPSSKKRRRQKGQPSEATNTGISIEKKSSCAKNQTGSVAFILGIEPDHGQSTSHPFLISCDTDSSSDWSDSDLEVDDVDGESMEDFCSFKNPLSLFNLQVMCSLQPTSHSQCSALDAINMSWQINVSVDSDDKHKPKSKKKSSAKKVCFVEDKGLETVHNMFTWSYAYAAARKGPWEEIARDRGRFLRRITDGEKLLKPILNTKHRENVFQERFKTDTVYNDITV